MGTLTVTETKSPRSSDVGVDPSRGLITIRPVAPSTRSLFTWTMCSPSSEKDTVGNRPTRLPAGKEVSVPRSRSSTRTRCAQCRHLAAVGAEHAKARERPHSTVGIRQRADRSVWVIPGTPPDLTVRWRGADRADEDIVSGCNRNTGRNESTLTCCRVQEENRAPATEDHFVSRDAHNRHPGRNRH